MLLVLVAGWRTARRRSDPLQTGQFVAVVRGHLVACIRRRSSPAGRLGVSVVAVDARSRLEVLPIRPLEALAVTGQGSQILLADGSIRTI